MVEIGQVSSLRQSCIRGISSSLATPRICILPCFQFFSCSFPRTLDFSLSLSPLIILLVIWFRFPLFLSSSVVAPTSSDLETTSYGYVVDIRQVRIAMKTMWTQRENNHFLCTHQRRFNESAIFVVCWLQCQCDKVIQRARLWQAS